MENGREVKNIRVLITGVRGFVGTNLLKYLEKVGHLSITGSSRNKTKIEYLVNYIDHICSFDEIFRENKSFDCYIHLSGKVYDLNDKSDEKEYYDVNYGETKRLFDHFLSDPNAKKFIFLSTIHVLAETPEKVLDEEYNPKPFTPYGKSKYKAEKYLLSNQIPGKKVYVLRPAMIHGPGNKGNLNLLFNLVKKGIPYPLGKINNKRSFVSVDNLSFIIYKLMSEEISSGLYHIADDEPTYTHDLIRLIAENVNKKEKIWNINLLLLSVIAKIGNILPLPINEHRLNKLTGDFIVSNDKIKREIECELPISSKEGLLKTIDHLSSVT